ncbi:uncharacterized protein LOC117790824 [Drosophila innubila]|uniref:uncharacterized protein LOC117790824 n=1 Tax=Drosophila innubila TaxID=198719 RepID=UPI00148D716A|nr:uncharacterized protein LOC117790824 [Drosophila innubila]
MDRYCIVCGEVPTSTYTYPYSIEEAIKWQKMLSVYVPVETLRHHCCVCNKHIANSKSQESVSKRSAIGERSKHNDLNEQRLSVKFKESDAIHYFGKNKLESKDFNGSQSSDSQSDATQRQLRRKDGCTQLSKSSEPQIRSNPIWAPSAVTDSDFANSLMSSVLSDEIEERSTSGFETATQSSASCPCGYSCGFSNSDSSNMRDQNSTCMCGQSCPQMALENARMKQWSQGCTAAQVNSDQSYESSLNNTYSSGIPLRNGNQRLGQQQHQECQCSLTPDSCDQVLQCPSQGLNPIPIPKKSCYCELNSNTTLCSNFYDSKSIQTNQTNSSNAHSGISNRVGAVNNCINNQLGQAPINVLIMGGSMVPSYYTCSDNRQSMLSEICVLESDLAHEGAKFLDVDVPKYTICRTPQERKDNGGNGVVKKESFTEVLLMGKAPSIECTCPDSKTKQPFNSDNNSKDLNCNELMRNQETRMLELESLLTQQHKLQQSIQAKLNELQNTTSAGKKSGAPKANANGNVPLKMSPTMGKSLAK